MAKSIREQIIEGRFDVNHDGTTKTFTVADIYKGLTDDILYNEDKLIQHCVDRGILLALIHTGLQQEWVNQRAIVRRRDASGAAIPLTTENCEKYQKAITAYRPVLLPKPMTETAKLEKAIEGLSNEKLLELMKSRGLI